MFNVWCLMFDVWFLILNLESLTDLLPSLKMFHRGYIIIIISFLWKSGRTAMMKLMLDLGIGKEMGVGG